MPQYWGIFKWNFTSNQRWSFFKKKFTELRVFSEYTRYSYEIQDSGTAIVEKKVGNGKRTKKENEKKEKTDKRQTDKKAQKTNKKNSKMDKEDTKKLIQNRKAAKKLRDKKNLRNLFWRSKFQIFCGKINRWKKRLKLNLFETGSTFL